MFRVLALIMLMAGIVFITIGYTKNVVQMSSTSD